MSEQENTPSEKFRVEPEMPVQSPSKLEALLEAYNDRITPLLPNVYEDEEGVSWSKFKTAIRNAVVDLPDILKCTQQSIVQAAITACELGLHVGKARGEGYILPFKNGPLSTKLGFDVYDATFIPGYKGLIRNAYGTGQVKLVEAFVVYKQDTFKPPTRTLGIDGYVTTFEHSPYIPEGLDDAPVDKDIIGCMYVILLDNGEVLTDFLNLRELEKIRKSSKVPWSPAYKGWLAEMYKKGALRRGLKTAKIEDARFSDTLAAANGEFDFEPTEKKNDKEALQDLNKNLLQKARDAAEDATVIEYQEDVPVENVDMDTGEIKEPAPTKPAPAAEPEDEEDDDMDTEGEFAAPGSNPTHFDYINAIKTGVNIYFEPFEELEAPFDFIELIVGDRPNAIEQLPENWAKKIAKIMNRSHIEFNGNGDTPARVSNFFYWVLSTRPKFDTVRAMVTAASDFRKFEKEMLESESTEPEQEPTPEPIAEVPEEKPKAATKLPDTTQGRFF